MRIENLQNENRKYAKSIENFHVLEYVQDASVSPIVPFHNSSINMPYVLNCDPMSFDKECELTIWWLHPPSPCRINNASTGYQKSRTGVIY